MAQIPRRTFTLIFEGAAGDEDLAEFEVKVRAPSVRESLDYYDTEWLNDASLSLKQRSEKFAEAYEVLAGRLVSWNLEDDGVPIPATLEGLHSLPADVGGRILGSWLFETATVPRPLPNDSPAGGPTVDESLIPMTLDAVPLS